MLAQQVVPHRDRVGSPLQTHLVFRNRGLGNQVIQQSIGFWLEVLAAADVLEGVKVREMGGERRIDEQHLFARLRMDKHNRVLSDGVLRGHRVTIGDRHLGEKGVLGIVLGVHAIDSLFDGLRQAFIGHHHVGPNGVAAGLRTQFTAQHRAAGRRLLEGDIGMPQVFAADLFDHILLVGVEIAVQHQQLVRLRMAGRNGMSFQFSELRREILLLHRSDVLIAKEQHFIFEPQRPDLCDHFRVLGSVGQADVADLGADVRRAKLNLDRMLKSRRTDDRR
ncbi:hypothetical protein D9M73_139140 [compost metagenome]